MKSIKDKLYPSYHRYTVDIKLKMQSRYYLSETHKKAVAILDFTSFRQRLLFLTKSSCEIEKRVYNG